MILAFTRQLRISGTVVKYAKQSWKHPAGATQHVTAVPKSEMGFFPRNLCTTVPLRSSEDLLVSVENGVKKIVFNRPKVKNALTAEMVKRLGIELSAKDDSKLITITGAGDFFTAGNDLMNWNLANQTLPELKEKSRSHTRVFMYGLLDCEKPIISLVNGGAVGMGVTMLPFCDQVMASDTAFFSTPFVSLGIVPEFCSSHTFPKIMGYAKANEMLLFGHKMTAQEALQCGFVAKVFPEGSFVENCQKLIDQYSKLPLQPLMQAKKMIRAQEHQKLRQLAAYEMDHVLEETVNPHMQAVLDNFFCKKS